MNKSSIFSIPLLLLAAAIIPFGTACSSHASRQNENKNPWLPKEFEGQQIVLTADFKGTVRELLPVLNEIDGASYSLLITGDGHAPVSLPSGKYTPATLACAISEQLQLPTHIVGNNYFLMAEEPTIVSAGIGDGPPQVKRVILECLNHRVSFVGDNEEILGHAMSRARFFALSSAIDRNSDIQANILIKDITLQEALQVWCILNKKKLTIYDHEMCITIYGIQEEK